MFAQGTDIKVSEEASRSGSRGTLAESPWPGAQFGVTECGHGLAETRGLKGMQKPRGQYLHDSSIIAGLPISLVADQTRHGNLLDHFVAGEVTLVHTVLLS